MKYLASFFAFTLLFSGYSTQLFAQSKMNSNIDNKVDSLLALMTLEEKIGQLNLYNGTWDFTGPVPENDYSQVKAENIRKGRVGAMLNVLTVKAIREAQEMAVEESRLGIPMLFGYDVVHGYKTMLPIPLAQASSWDESVAFKGNQLAAKEAASSGLNWAFAPMIDVSRDARWGRIMEGAGEDTYLSSVMARAWVRGFQGEDLMDRFSIAACAKHFAGYGFAEAGREYNTSEITTQTLHNVVLPPFKAAVDAGVASFMNGFQDLNGIPVTANEYLQRTILKGSWGFDGFVVSDYNSIAELVSHGYSKDGATAAEDALKAGSDMDMEGRIYENYLTELLERDKDLLEKLDDATRRILRVKFELGLFEDPYKYCDEAMEKSNLLTKENMEITRDAARKSMVLLKNEGSLLPLDKKIKSIAVIGQLAASKDIPLGSWRAQAESNSAVSLLEGIRAATKANVTFAEGYKITEGDRTFIYPLNFAEPSTDGFKEAKEIAAKSDVVILALGEDCFQSGEGRSQADIGLKGNQLELLMELLEVNKKTVVVLMNGRPLAIPEVMKHAPAVLESWFAGSQAGHAISDILFGSYNPSGKLPVSFPYHVGQEPLHYDRKSTGRPQVNEFDAGMVFWSHYEDMPNEALLPFGFGLSYSEFEYTNLEVKVSGDGVQVSVNVSNVGKVTGKETVQCYIRDVYARQVQPMKRLVDFAQVELAPGETQTVNFSLKEEHLGYYHTPDGDFYAEDGLFHIMIGGNSVDLLKEEVEIDF
jgi:beta-glucosidase